MVKHNLNQCEAIMYLFIPLLLFLFCTVLGLNALPLVCCAGALPLKPHFSPTFVFVNVHIDNLLSDTL
jgi:hypothetical protein